MTPEQLLQPRYKVIADWPLNDYFDVGEIILDEDSFIFKIGNKETNVKDYPHLFRPLEWWEDRKQEDMPWWVKTYSGDRLVRVARVRLFDFNETSAYWMYLESEGTPYCPSSWLPATEAEYLEYKNKQP